MSRAAFSRQIALAGVDIAREDGAVGAVLDLDPVGGDVDRRVAVMALQRRAGRLAERPGATASSGSKARGRKRFTPLI